MDVVVVTMLFGVLGIMIGYKAGLEGGKTAANDRQYWARNGVALLVGVAVSAVVAATGLLTLMGLSIGPVSYTHLPAIPCPPSGRRRGRDPVAHSLPGMRAPGGAALPGLRRRPAGHRPGPRLPPLRRPVRVPCLHGVHRLPRTARWRAGGEAPGAPRPCRSARPSRR